LAADDLDVQLGQCTTELGHAGAAWSVRPVDPKDGVLIRIKSHWPPEGNDVGVYRAQVAVRASLSTNRSCTSRLVASSINTKQGTSITPALEPAMIAAVNLDQLSECLTAQSRLMEVATPYFQADRVSASG
jgi:hypothetical protein